AGVAARRSGPGTTGPGTTGTGRGGRRGTDRAGRREITGAGPHGTGREPRRGPRAARPRPRPGPTSAPRPLPRAPAPPPARGAPRAGGAGGAWAAGGHHLCLLGPPGSGKTMLAERLPTVMPLLDRAAALEVTAIHSVAGTLPAGSPLMTEPPFCAPHHTATK